MVDKGMRQNSGNWTREIKDNYLGQGLLKLFHLKSKNFCKSEAEFVL